MGKVAVLGVGNRYRGDDGAGLVAIDALEKKIPKEVHLHRVRSDIGEVLDLFARYPVVYVIDAYAAAPSEEPWRRIDLMREPVFVENPLTSTHGFTIKEAFELAKTLGGLPSTLILYAISGRFFSLSAEISPAVLAAVDQVVCHLLNEKEIQACMNRV